MGYGAARYPPLVERPAAYDTQKKDKCELAQSLILIWIIRQYSTITRNQKNAFWGQFSSKEERALHMII